MHCPACGARVVRPLPTPCLACQTPLWRNAKPCAGALVVEHGRLLLIRRANEPWLDHWDIPGGFCEADEHPADTAVRETAEETGLEIQLTGILGLWIDQYTTPAYAVQPELTLNVYYHAVPLGGTASAVDPVETAAVEWFEPTTLPEKLAFPAHARLALGAWREALRSGQTHTLLPDRT